ncbi:hypothetical protein Mycch_5163 [Mycolicibacterium chubuense NBB4]|uniref:Uncharacterized protein n=1 Tax=Mycolicibacterium chubuense (strain NBB4) TaxID=710421 RepID=I4BRE2_MYCCN|nr:hypothetical protein [Mycolicibacterium chubuense]AFM19849.1 hypothetical protein Mycch_5163 [Mycolicibacterium chubuense NBB4]
MLVRLDLRASSAEEVVGGAGGWLCDRVRQGWTVTVAVPTASQTRALSILGVALRHPSDEAPGGALSLVLSGSEPEPGTGGPGRHIQHRLSSAARAFKTHALAAADLGGPAAGEESFWLTGPMAGLVDETAAVDLSVSGQP